MKTKIKSGKNILTPEEFEKYSEGWNNFKDKYKVNNSYNVNNGLPVISLVYQFEDKPLFRTHVFSKKLRSYDPYHIADKCLQPFWHAQHYIMMGEQLYTAASRLIIGDEYNKMIAKDVPINFHWEKEILWNDNISVELIKKGKGRRQVGYFTMYSEKTKKILSKMIAASFWGERAYRIAMKKARQGDKKALEKLIRQIEFQDINLRRLIKPRKHLLSTKDYLISELKAGRIPEEKLIDDYSSFWDKD